MQCYKCNKIFNLKTDLNRHLDKKIPCDCKIECNSCKREFKTKQQLEKHLNNKKPCNKIDLEMENKILKLEKENLELKIKSNCLKQTYKKLISKPKN